MDVNKKQLQFFSDQTWDKSEKVMLAVPCEYKKQKKKFTNGFLVCTYGTNYIYKSKLFGLPHQKFVFHLLDCIKFHVLENSLLLTYDSYMLQIKVQNVAAIASVMLRIFSEMTWGCKFAELMEIQSDIHLPDYKVYRRAPNSLMNRALFFSHFYNASGNQLETLVYLKKLEEKESNNITISKRFHPGNFAESFGHAIAWEASLNTLSMQSFAPTKFPMFFHALLENSQTIDRVVFIDYKEKVPPFNFSGIEETIVRRFWFMRCFPEIIIKFVEASRKLSISMDELLITQCTFSTQDFFDLVNKISKCQYVKRASRIFLSRIEITPFPFDDFIRLISLSHQLHTLTITETDVDATDLLKAISFSQTHARVIRLCKLNFKTIVPPQTFPPRTLLAFNVSQCVFTPESLKSIFEYICSSPLNFPIIFLAQLLDIKPEVYSSLADLNYGSLYPNIGEFDWSGNVIPNHALKDLFAFLYTQKRCHLLTMNEVKPEDGDQFLGYLSKFAISLPLLGLDLSGNFMSHVFIPFLETLKDAKLLRRLKIKNSTAGDEGLAKYTELINSLPDLTEVGGDGFRPTSIDRFIRFWFAVRDHPKIKTCNLPRDDLISIGLTVAMMTPDVKGAFIELRNRPRMSTVSQRLEYLTQQLEMFEDDEESSTFSTETDTEIYDKTSAIIVTDPHHEGDEDIDIETFQTENFEDIENEFETDELYRFSVF